MAYAFDRINRALADDRDEEEKPYTVSNVGSPTPASLGQVPESSEPSNRKVNKFNPSAASEAKFAAYRGKSEIPGFVGNISDNLDSAKAKIAGEAKAYKDKESDETRRAYGVTPKEITGAYDPGYSHDMDRINRILGSAPRDIPRPNLPTPVVPHAEDITSVPKIKELYRREAGPRYTPGMAEFDAQLLTSTPQFMSKVRALAGGQEELKKFATGEYNNALNAAKKDSEDTLANTKKYIKDYLTAAEGKLTQDQIDEANALTKKLDDIYNRTDADYVGLLNKSKEEIRNKLLSNNGVDLPAYYADNWINTRANNDLGAAIKPGNYAKGYVFKPEDVTTPHEGSNFWRIKSLLGTTGGLPQPSPSITEVPDLAKLMAPGADFNDKISRKYVEDQIAAMKGSKEHSELAKAFQDKDYKRINNRLVDWIEKGFDKNFRGMSPEEKTKFQKIVDFAINYPEKVPYISSIIYNELGKTMKTGDHLLVTDASGNRSDQDRLNKMIKDYSSLSRYINKDSTAKSLGTMLPFEGTRETDSRAIFNRMWEDVLNAGRNG